MSATANRTAAAGAGCFATAPRARVDTREVERLRARRFSVQNIAQMLGCSMEDVSRVLAPKPANDDEPEWPLGECSDLARSIIEHVAKQHDISVAEAAMRTVRGERAGLVRAAMYCALQELGNVTVLQIACIFRRDQASVQLSMARHRARVFGTTA